MEVAGRYPTDQLLVTKISILELRRPSKGERSPDVLFVQARRPTRLFSLIVFLSGACNTIAAILRTNLIGYRHSYQMLALDLDSMKERHKT